jgi:hypothetical protein
MMFRMTEWSGVTPIAAFIFLPHFSAYDWIASP